MFVVGAVNVNSLRPSFARGRDGDGILTVSAPGQYVSVARPYTNSYALQEGTSFGEPPPFSPL